MKHRTLAALVAFAVAACATTPPPPMALATAQVADDFDTYELRRIGLLPPQGDVVSPAAAEALQDALYMELSRSSPFELVPLDTTNLEETPGSEPYLRGWYHRETVLALSKRFHLDALLFSTVTEQRPYPPQVLSLQVDMIAVETGLVVWSSSVHLDAADEVVRAGLRGYYGAASTDTELGTDWQVALLSPERFARFAAYQIASML